MKQNWVLIVILVIVVVAFYFIVQPVREGVQQTQQILQPFQKANNELQTQIAELLHPTPTVIPDPVTYIHEIQALARLETIQYSVEKVITAEIGQGKFDFLFGDKLLFVAHGIVVAGIDMKKIMPDDMKIRNGVLYVKLPPPEVFVATLDNEKSYVYDRETGVLTHGDINLETTARQVAEAEIRKAAEEDGILTLAGHNAEAFLQKFFTALGYQTVIFIN